MPEITNKAYIRKYILQIGVNEEVKTTVLASGKKDFADRKQEKTPEFYSDRYKTNNISSNDLTTVPLKVVTITDPIQLEAEIVDPKSGQKVNINKSSIRLYNLSEETYSQIKTGASIFLRAGYEQDGEDLPHVFIGQITKVRNVPEYNHTVTYIEANSCEIVRNGAYLHKSYPKSSNLKGIIEDLATAIAKSGIPIGSINTQSIASRLMEKSYPSGYMVTGSPLESLEKVCDDNGLKAYVTQGRLYVEPKQARGQLGKLVIVGDGQFKGKVKEAKDKKGEELTSDQDFKDNFDLKLNLYLDGNITSDAIVQVTAKGYEGMYTIKEVSHTLNWKKGDWDTDVTLLLIEN